MILTNLGYLVGLTDIRNYLPQLFGVPFGMMLLFGPLIYFYSKSVIDASFKWKSKYWLHFVLYFVQVAINLPLFLMDKTEWNGFINTFLLGDLPVRWAEMLLFFIQDIQFFIYLLLTFRWIRKAKSSHGSAQYIISLSSRIKWLSTLTYSFSLFLLTVVLLYIILLITGKYIPAANYAYTLFTSCIIYFIAYKLVLNPELISPDFTQKYRAYMQFAGEDGERYLQKLKSLMDESKIFLNPQLKLSLLAEQVGLPRHQLSKLINEKFGKSFNDYVNEHRVNEFIRCVGDSKYQSLSIYGIALEVGFNSKSSFNTAFKKVTGKTPSEFKSSS